MKVKQFENENLAHYSYAVLSECEKKIILIDPSRDPAPYLEYAKEQGAEITGIIETHPHADFVSSHLEFQRLYGSAIYASSLVNATYPHTAFDEGYPIELGKIRLEALNTPGHSPDSICILLEHEGKTKFVFTGDTLFIGDCGRPDLRAGGQDAAVAAAHLAKQMYHSLRDKLIPLSDDVIVYPAHGAGTLCGKSLGKESVSTMGQEKKNNWSLQEQAEDSFVKELLAEQPFIPVYFPYDVEMNKAGAPAFAESIKKVNMIPAVCDLKTASGLDNATWVIDCREAAEYKKGHLSMSVNLMLEKKFETWLGSIIKPNEFFYLAAETDKDLGQMIERAAAIGYENQIKAAFIVAYDEVEQEEIDVNKFAGNTSAYTIIDVRNTGEVKKEKIFSNSINIPLGELRERIPEIPLDKPIVVHCASGYRSAAGSSLIQSALNSKINVFDLGETVKKFI